MVWIRCIEIHVDVLSRSISSNTYCLLSSVATFLNFFSHARLLTWSLIPLKIFLELQVWSSLSRSCCDSFSRTIWPENHAFLILCLSCLYFSHSFLVSFLLTISGTCYEGPPSHFAIARQHFMVRCAEVFFLIELVYILRSLSYASDAHAKLELNHGAFHSFSCH